MSRSACVTRAKFRTLIAFGETPDRWQWEVKSLTEAGDLLDPEAHLALLNGLWETKADLVPQLDSIDHALDYLGELEAQGESPYDAPVLTLSGSAGQDTALRSAAGLPAIGEALNTNTPRVDGFVNTPLTQDPPVFGASTPPLDANDQAEYIDLNAKIGEAETRLAADTVDAEKQEQALRTEGVSRIEAARAMGAAKEKLKSANNEIAGRCTRLVEIVEIVPSPAHSINPRAGSLYRPVEQGVG